MAQHQLPRGVAAVDGAPLVGDGVVLQLPAARQRRQRGGVGVEGQRGDERRGGGAEAEAREQRAEGGGAAGEEGGVRGCGLEEEGEADEEDALEEEVEQRRAERAEEAVGGAREAVERAARLPRLHEDLPRGERVEARAEAVGGEEAVEPLEVLGDVLRVVNLREDEVGDHQPEPGEEVEGDEHDQPVGGRLEEEGGGGRQGQGGEAEEGERERRGAEGLRRAGELIAAGDGEDEERAREDEDVHESVPAPRGEPVGEPLDARDELHLLRARLTLAQQRGDEGGGDEGEGDEDHDRGEHGDEGGDLRLAVLGEREVFAHGVDEALVARRDGDASVVQRVDQRGQRVDGACIEQECAQQRGVLCDGADHFARAVGKEVLRQLDGGEGELFGAVGYVRGGGPALLAQVGRERERGVVVGEEQRDGARDGGATPCGGEEDAGGRELDGRPRVDNARGDVEDGEREEDEDDGEEQLAGGGAAVAPGGEGALHHQAAVRAERRGAAWRRRRRRQRRRDGDGVRVRLRLGGGELREHRHGELPRLALVLLPRQPLERGLVDLEEDVLERGARRAVLLHAERGERRLEREEELLQLRQVVARQLHHRLDAVVGDDPAVGRVPLDELEDLRAVEGGGGRLDERERVADAEVRLEEERGADAAQPPLRHDGDAVGEQLRLVEEVRGEHERPPLALLSQQPPDGAAGVRVHAGGGLVEEDGARAAHQSDAEAQLALLPAGERAGGRVLALGELHLLEHLLDRLVQRGAEEALERAVQPQVLRRREALEDHVHLRADAEGEADLRHLRRDALAVDARVARGRRDQPSEHRDGGGLPRAVGAEQRGDLPRAHLQVERVHRHAARPHLAQPRRPHARVAHRLRQRLDHHRLLARAGGGEEGGAAAAARAAAAPVRRLEQEPRLALQAVLRGDDLVEVPSQAEPQDNVKEEEGERCRERELAFVHCAPSDALLRAFVLRHERGAKVESHRGEERDSALGADAPIGKLALVEEEVVELRGEEEEQRAEERGEARVGEERRHGQREGERGEREEHEEQQHERRRRVGVAREADLRGADERGGDEGGAVGEEDRGVVRGEGSAHHEELLAQLALLLEHKRAQHRGERDQRAEDDNEAH
mmetsp:Transcript_36033/g.87523  ORF Transcript_36033/g.87523 Transcript_36033/m.87523 type:complete len:1121 (-) Transcript_36033:371-3733(-)